MSLYETLRLVGLVVAAIGFGGMVWFYWICAASGAGESGSAEEGQGK